MIKISLHFLGDAPELIGVSFEHPYNRDGALVSKRGKLEANSFQWTAAVQALAFFLAKCCEAAYRGCACAYLEGYPGSWAGALDNALSKQPRWLVDMFGVDEDGLSLLRRLVMRSNSSCKHYGPVRIAAAKCLLDPATISIHHGQKHLLSHHEISALVQSIERGDADQTGARESVRCDPSHHDLVNIYRREAIRMLWHTEIFDPIAYACTLEKIQHSPLYRGIAGTRALVPHEDLRLAKKGALLPTSPRHEALTRIGRELTVAAPFAAAGTLAIFGQLMNEDLPFRLDYRFPHAIAIRRAISEMLFVRAPDLIVLGTGPAASILGDRRRSEYQPLMLLPALSHRVLLRPADGASDRASFRGDLYLLKDEPSSPAFCLDALYTCKFFERRKIATHHAEPQAAYALFGHSEARGASLDFFPYYILQERLNALHTATEDYLPGMLQPMVLFVHSRIADDIELTTAIRLFVRCAWKKLRYYPELLDSTFYHSIAGQTLSQICAVQ